MSLGALKRLAAAHGLAPGAKRVTEIMERRSRDFHCGFLRGLFDADGSVQGSHEKGVSIRLAQSDMGTLKAVQRMALRLGVASTIYEERRPARQALLPDGRQGSRHYATRPQHELVIAGDNIAVFAERIGFADTEKAQRLTRALDGYRRALNRERFSATVKSIQPAGDAEVYDAAIPGLNAFDANGLWAHNCGEQPLPPYGACLLGSVNLATLVDHPFTGKAALNEDRLAELARTAVRLLDNVIDVSGYPLKAQAEEAKAKRRLGIGVTGLADALILCGKHYGTDDAVKLAARWMSAIQRNAYMASTDLAAEKGSFPLFDAEKYLASEGAKELPEDVRKAIRQKGLRNGLLTSIAPTGTISIIANNVSSGIEPVFDFSYRRRILRDDGTADEECVEDFAYRLYRETFGTDAPLPESFVRAPELHPHQHLAMQAALQPHVDAAISKTINCAQDIVFDDFKDIYTRAYETGLKGCTVYRPNPVTGAVLSSGDGEGERPEAPAVGHQPQQQSLGLSAPAPEREQGNGEVVYMSAPLERDAALPGYTYKLKWPGSGHAIYVTINDIIQDGRRRPFEIFINSKNLEHYAWTVALTRMISAVFRRGGDVSFVVEELKDVFDPRGGDWVGGRYVPSLLAAIGEVIERHMIDIGFIQRDDAETGFLQKAAGAPSAQSGGSEKLFCPQCGRPAMVYQEGCLICRECGYSSCG